MFYLWAINSDYDRARNQADVVRASIQDEDGQPQLGNLPQLTEDLNQLEEDLRTLDKRIDMPVVGSIAQRAPIVGTQIKASRDLLDLGIELTMITRDASEIANEIRDAFEANGFMDTGPAVGPTWLDVVNTRQQEIHALEERFSAAVERRAALDVEHLPDRATNTLATLDELLERATGIRDEYFHLFPLLDAAFGGDGEARYLVLLQNGQELRQAGGFPGTYAAITIANGRITNLEIQSIGYLNAAYAEARPEVLPAPGPLQVYLKQEQWLPHDAGWSPDFPEVAETLFAMYDVTGWPPVDGVMALNSGAIEDILELLGAYELEIDGETQRVDSENFLDLIQSYRNAEGTHKEVVGILGRSLIDQVRAADFDTKKAIFFLLRDAANQREIQVAMRDPVMQAEVVLRGWDGAIYPDPAIPTLAMTVANVTGNKTSENIEAHSAIDIAGDAPRTVRWTITFNNYGDPEGVEEYHGFHRTWVQIYLPPGADVTSTSQAPEPAEVVGDDRALGFHVELHSGASKTLELEFTLPDGTDSLLLRRQSGMNDLRVEVTAATAVCSLSEAFYLSQDSVIDLTACETRWHRE